MSKYRSKGNLPARCGWCSRGVPSADGACILCKKRGVMDADDHCPHYDYDPLRREPLPQPALPLIDGEEFRL